MTLGEASKPLGARLADTWSAFWFKPQPAYTLGAVRIAFGTIVALWTLSLIGDLADFFSEYGVAPQQRAVPFQLGIFAYWTDDRALMIGWTLLLVSALALAVGWHSRLAALIVYVLLASFEFRNQNVFNSGDALLRIEALFLAFAPSGAALSLDQRRRTGSFWTAQNRAPYTVKLLQIQLTVIYVATFLIRMRGTKWLDGTAMSYALRLEDMLVVPVPEWITVNPLLMNIATWGTLLLEPAIGILVWNRRCRPYLLLAGLALHLTILVTVAVGFFTPAMLVLYVAFIDPETIRRLPDRLRRLTRLPPKPSSSVDDHGEPITRAGPLAR
jgi:Vitamin K-dependent gamma-carboxylase